MPLGKQMPAKGAWHKRLCNYLVVGKPAALQAFKPPAIERTFL